MGEDEASWTSTRVGDVITCMVSPSSQRSCRWYRAAAWSTVSAVADAALPLPGAAVGCWWLSAAKVLRASACGTRWLISMIRLERVVGESHSSWWSGTSRRVLGLSVSFGVYV